MEKLDLIKRALDSNAFDSAETAAGYVNPEYWDKQLFDHIRANLVVLPAGRDMTSRFPKDGDTFNMSLLAEPASASSVAETASVAIVAFAPTQVVLSPSEHGIAYQTTDKELRRAFFPLMDQFTQDIGYGLALQADTLAVSQCQNSAGNSIVANGVASTALASSDTMDHEEVARMMLENAKDKYTNHTALIVSMTQWKDLSQDSNFLTADKFGADAAVVRKGFVGMVYGIPTFATTQISEAGNDASAILISSPDAFVYIFKTPSGGAIARDYIALERRHDIVGVIDFDVVVARTNAICVNETYTA